MQFLGIATLLSIIIVADQLSVIIFSSNNFIDHTYRTICSLPVYEVNNIQVFAFKIVHNDAGHDIVSSSSL